MDLGFALWNDLFLIFIFILVQFLVLVIIGALVYWFDCSLLCFFFLSFFLPFLLSHVADRVLVLQPGVRPEPPRWES